MTDKANSASPLPASSRAVKVGNLIIGGGFPVSVQTMWKEPLVSVNQDLLQGIEQIKQMGCDILRFAVPDMKQAAFLGELRKKVSLPLVADIHFDYRIALECIRRGVDKLRINPGNIGPAWKVKEVLSAARDAGIPVRVGVNEGSLPRSLRRERDRARAMLAAAEEELAILQKNTFRDAVFSFKSSDVGITIEVNRKFRQLYDYPLHIGVTEAGPLFPGLVKNTAALYTLLSEGIGDTVRVSLTAAAAEEVTAGREILRAVGLTSAGVNLVSCPTCGRAEFPVREFYEKAALELAAVKKTCTIAIMGCSVNGPGEARHADLGITGVGKKALIFKKGEIIRRELMENALQAFIEELHNL